MNKQTQKTGSTKWRRAARALRYAAAGVGVLVALLVVALLLPPVRERLLGFGLSIANRALPGVIEVGSAKWPGLGTLEFDQIAWTDGDVLARADHVRVAIDLRALWRKDIEVDDVKVTNALVRLPAIASRFRADGEQAARVEDDDGGGGFPRAGSLPGLPSIALHRIALTGVELEITDSLAVRNIIVLGGADLLADHSPRINLQRIEATSGDDTWGLEALALDVDFAAGLMNGRATGRLMPEVPFEMLLEPAGRDSFALQLSAGADSTGRVEVEATGRLRREGLNVSAISSILRLSVPGTRVLATSPIVGGVAGDLPVLEGVTMTVVSRIQLTPLVLAADVTADPNAWLSQLRTQVTVDEAGVRFDDYELRMPGLSLSGHAHKLADELDARSSIRIEDARWLAIVAPEAVPPNPLSASLEVNVAGSLDALATRIEASAVVGGFELERSNINGVVSVAPRLAASLSIAATAFGLDVDVDADIEKDEDIVARVSPIVVREKGQAGKPGAQRGLFRYASDGAVTMEDLRIEGSVGSNRVSASLDSTLTGEARVSCTWQTVPTALLRLAGLEPDSLGGLQEAWQRDAPFSLDASVRLGGREGTIVAEVPFTLPGPRNLIPLLPDSIDVDDIGPLRGTLTADILTGGEQTLADLMLDLRETEWVDSSHVHVVYRGDATDVDSLRLGVFGLLVAADGRVGDLSDLRVRLSLPNTDGMSRFVGGIPNGSLEAAAHVTGPIADPFVRVSFNASVMDDAYSIPRVDGTVDFNRASLSVAVTTPDGVEAGDISLSTVELNVQSEAGMQQLLPVRVDLAVVGGGFEWFHSLVADTTDGLRLDVDTLSAVIGGQDLRSSGPFSLGMVRSSDAVFADHLHLNGELGHIRAAGYVSADSADMEIGIDLSLPPSPAALAVPHGFWPRRLLLDVDVAAPDDIIAKLKLRGFLVGDGRQPDLDVDLSARGDSLRATLSMVDSTSQFMSADVLFPARVIAYPPSAEMQAGDLDVDVTLDDFPLGLFVFDAPDAVPEGEVANIDARLQLAGTTDRPFGSADLSVSFPDWPKLAAYRLDLAGTLGRGEQPDSLIRASFNLMRSEETVLQGAVRHPSRVSFHPFAWNTEQDGLWFEVSADSLTLAEFDPLIPVDMSLSGALTLHVTGEGKVDDPMLNGKLKTDELMVALAQQARMTANLDITLTGPASAPRINGSVVISRGVIQIPDLPPNLHPVDGDALLFGDSLSVVPVPEDTALNDADTISAFNPEFDVTVKIPGGFFLRGKGLDLELGGDLRIRQAGQTPEIVGELRAVRGRLDLLGRRLTLEEGSVRFTGGDEINPELSVTLTTQVNDVRVRILFGGTVQEPAIFFSSEPQMDEGDIMAVLLFGRPIDQLDDDQTNHMQQRTTEVVVALGTAQLQQQFSQQFGVDVFAYKAGDKEEALGSFQFGKYLNPQVLLSYVRSLDDADDSYVSLEYFFTGRFKIQTVYGRRQSGGGVGWQKDY